MTKTTVTFRNHLGQLETVSRICKMGRLAIAADNGVIGAWQELVAVCVERDRQAEISRIRGDRSAQFAALIRASNRDWFWVSVS